MGGISQRARLLPTDSCFNYKIEVSLSDWVPTPKGPAKWDIIFLTRSFNFYQIEGRWYATLYQWKCNMNLNSWQLNEWKNWGPILTIKTGVNEFCQRKKLLVVWGGFANVESTRKLSNFNFQWTKTLYQNNSKNIAIFFTFSRAIDVISYL